MSEQQLSGVDQSTPEQTQQDLSELARIRREKLDSLRAEGKNPFQLDSPEPDTSKLMDFLMGENRFASLKNNFPAKADALYEKEIADVKARYAKYRRMADGSL